MHKTTVIFTAASALLLAACGRVHTKSLPWPTTTTVFNAPALDFLRQAPPVDVELGRGIQAKDIGADQMLAGLSVSGGGARATAFTLGALAELQTITLSAQTNALDRIDFVSSNSGGRWVIAAYLADRASQGPKSYSLQARMPILRKAFIKASDGLVGCWRQAMAEGPIGQATFGDIYSGQIGSQLPRVYFNTTLFPAHAPFVFTDKFLSYYQVQALGACHGRQPTAISRLADVPIADAASASGSVPGFYAAYAQTRLCRGVLDDASFCFSNRKGGILSDLRLADGGLYDNIAYKTAWEVMRAATRTTPLRQRAMLLVNSAATIDNKTISEGQHYKTYLDVTATNGVFGVQDSTFERLYRPMFESLGVDDPVLLDFYSTAKFRPDQAELLAGLNALTYYAAHKVKCYVGKDLKKYERGGFPHDSELPSSEESLAYLEAKKGDCLSENFYRVGTLSKTTYKFDKVLFDVMWQLGQLSVRLYRKRIVQVLDRQ